VLSKKRRGMRNYRRKDRKGRGRRELGKKVPDPWGEEKKKSSTLVERARVLSITDSRKGMEKVAQLCVKRELWRRGSRRAESLKRAAELLRRERGGNNELTRRPSTSHQNQNVGTATERKNERGGIFIAKERMIFLSGEKKKKTLLRGSTRSYLASLREGPHRLRGGLRRGFAQIFGETTHHAKGKEENRGRSELDCRRFRGQGITDQSQKGVRYAGSARSDQRRERKAIGGGKGH